MKRLWPVLIPALVLVHVAIPGTLGTLKESFAPPGGLLAEQQVVSGGGVQPGGGRLADIAPSRSASGGNGHSWDMVSGLA